MAKFAYNNIKNASTSHTFLELNHDYHLCIAFEKEIDLCFQLIIVDKLSIELRELMITCRKNFYHA